MDLKEQVKQYISIVDVASLYVNLKPAGKNLKALCPFHTEKTPSFFVMPDRNTFSCFGCNRFGDIFTLIQEMENIGFREAIDFLIDRFHLPVKKETVKGEKKDDYLQITEIAVRYFQENLQNGEEGEKARSYLQKRGITGETTATFSLGYASNSWDGLYGFMQRRKVPVDKAVELGLLVRNEKNRIYDRFRGRIIFPICSETGVPLAFGGRTIFDDEAKYLNSPESPIYKKGNHLYSFHLAKDAIRANKSAVLVEGYLDMITLYQAGIRHVAASLGTALTDKQVYLLKRFTENIFLFYDSDAAGIQAAMRGLEKLFELSLSARVIVDPECKDPDEFIRKKGGDAFEKACRESQDGFQFLLMRISSAYNLNLPEKKKSAIEAVLMVLRQIADPIVRDEYIQRAADFFRVDASLLKNERRGSASETEANASLRIGADEQEFLMLILAFPEIIEDIRDLLTPELLSVLAGRSLVESVLENTGPGKEFSIDAVSRRLNEHERALLNQIFIAGTLQTREYEEALKVLESCLLNFIKKMNKKKSHRLTREISQMEKENNPNQVRKLMEEKNMFKRMISKQDRGVES